MQTSLNSKLSEKIRRSLRLAGFKLKLQSHADVARQLTQIMAQEITNDIDRDILQDLQISQGLWA